MSDEIVLKTETVKIADLEGREKQIYDFAYHKGVEDYIEFSKNRYWISLIIFLFGVGALAVTLARSFYF